MAALTEHSKVAVHSLAAAHIPPAVAAVGDHNFPDVVAAAGVVAAAVARDDVDVAARGVDAAVAVVVVDCTAAVQDVAAFAAACVGADILRAAATIAAATVDNPGAADNTDPVPPVH